MRGFIRPTQNLLIMSGAGYYLGYHLFNWFQMNFLKRFRQTGALYGLTNGLIAATPENCDGKKNWGCGSTVLVEVVFPRTADED